MSISSCTEQIVRNVRDYWQNKLRIAQVIYVEVVVNGLQMVTCGSIHQMTDRGGDSSYAYGLNESGGGLLLFFAFLLRWARGAVPSRGTFSSPST